MTDSVFGGIYMVDDFRQFVLRNGKPESTGKGERARKSQTGRVQHNALESQIKPQKRLLRAGGLPW